MKPYKDVACRVIEAAPIETLLRHLLDLPFWEKLTDGLSNAEIKELETMVGNANRSCKRRLVHTEPYYVRIPVDG